MGLGGDCKTPTGSGGFVLVECRRSESVPEKYYDRFMSVALFEYTVGVL